MRSSCSKLHTAVYNYLIILSLQLSVLDEHLGIVPAKSLMTFYAEKVSSLEKGVAKVVCEHTLTRLQSRIVSFEEQVSLLRLSERPFTR